MLESPMECIRCCTPLKKQVMGSNEFYYCSKCGCTSSATSASSYSRCASSAIN